MIYLNIWYQFSMDLVCHLSPYSLYHQSLIVLWLMPIFILNGKYYTLFYIIIHYFTLLYIIIHYYTLLYIIIQYYTLLYIIIHYYTLFLNVKL